MRTEVKIGIGFCFVLVLVVVAYLAYHSGSGRNPVTSDKTGQVSRTTPLTTPGLHGTPAGRPASPLAQTPAGASARPTTPAPGGPMSALLPGAGPVQMASSAPASQPTSREAVASVGSLHSIESAGAPSSMTPVAPGMTAGPSAMSTASLGRPQFTPMQPVSDNSAPSPGFGLRTAGVSTADSPLRPLTSTGSTGSVGGQQTYVVATNDTLWKIATKVYGNGAQAALIEKANPGINASRLQVGQKLILPAAAAAATPAGSGGSSPAPVISRPDTTTGVRTLSAGQTPYIVKAGDNPSAIAAREYGDERLSAAILKANPGLVATSLKVGQTIILPSKAQAQSMAGVSGAPSVATVDRSAAISRATVVPAGMTTTANRSTSAVTATPAVAHTAPGYMEGKPYFGDR
jgi:nucleoid-associated protein YgaU